MLSVLGIKECGAATHYVWTTASPMTKVRGGGELRSTSPRHGIAETSFALLVWLIGDVFHKDCGSATSSGIYYSE